MTPAHADLIEASRAIGNISETAEWYSEELSDKIAATGKAVADLTVGELIALNTKLALSYRVKA